MVKVGKDGKNSRVWLIPLLLVTNAVGEEMARWSEINVRFLANARDGEYFKAHNFSLF